MALSGLHFGMSTTVAQLFRKQTSTMNFSPISSLNNASIYTSGSKDVFFGQSVNNDLLERSEFFKMLKNRQEAGLPLVIVAVDIDNTLYRKDRHSVSHAFAAKCQEANIPIVCVSGADIQEINDRMEGRLPEKGELPKTQMVCSSVGTRRHIRIDGNLTVDTAFDQTIADQGFVKSEILAEATQLVNQLASQLGFVKSGNQAAFTAIQGEDRFEDVGVFIPQPRMVEDPDQANKVSFHFYTDSDDVVRQLSEKFKESFEGRALVVTCEEINYNQAHSGEPVKKYCLDILPSTKEFPVNDLLRQLAEKFPDEPINVVAAGDSSNDEALLNGIQLPVPGSKVLSIVVGDAMDELIGTSKGFRNNETQTVIDDSASGRKGPESILYHMQEARILPS